MKKIATFIAFSLTSSVALAGDPSAALGLGTQLMDRFAEVLHGFEGVIRPIALSLFVTLMLIENGVWATKQLLNESLSMEAFVPKVAWNILVWGIFAWLVKDSHTIMKAIIDSFFKIGQDATGLGPLDAVGMMYLGVQTGLAIPQAADLGILSFLDKPFIVFTAIIAMLLLIAAFLVTACQLVMAQVEAMIVIAAAPLILAFGALSITRDIATKVLSHALGTGVKILTIYIIAGVMARMGPEISSVLIANSSNLMASPGQMLEVIAVSGLMTLLAFFIPTVAGAMLSGQASLSGNSAISSTLAIAAGSAAAGAMGISAARQTVGSLANGATGAVAGAAGLAQALGSAYNAAGDVGKTGLAGAAHAVGNVAGHAMGMAAGSIGDAVAGGGSSGSGFAEKVAGSTGGKIASRIEAERGGSISGSESSSSAAASSPLGENSADSSGSSAPASSSSSGYGDTSGPISGSSSAASSTAASSSVSRSNLAGFVPSAGLGNASTASISGGGEEKAKSKLGKLADVAANALGATQDMLNRTKEHVIEDRAQVGANIDTKAQY